MTRVLVVNHDVDLADLEVDELRRAGYHVDQCSGPANGIHPCPVMSGAPCWQVELADVLVYDAFAAGDGSSTLIDELCELHPTTPIVVTSSGPGLNWFGENAPPHVITVAGTPSTATLVKAIEAALAAKPPEDIPVEEVPDRVTTA